jgi:hypothetical protein
MRRALVAIRARENGVPIEDAVQSIVRDDGGERVVVDIAHPLYPRPTQHRPTVPTALAAGFGGGPGTELSKLLKRFGIEPTPTCSCRAKAAEMDAWGPDECSKPERIEEVVAVMREEAKARGLPFLDAAGRMLVKRAIQNARKATMH